MELGWQVPRDAQRDVTCSEEGQAQRLLGERAAEEEVNKAAHAPKADFVQDET